MLHIRDEHCVNQSFNKDMKVNSMTEETISVGLFITKIMKVKLVDLKNMMGGIKGVGLMQFPLKGQRTVTTTKCCCLNELGSQLSRSNL